MTPEEQSEIYPAGNSLSRMAEFTQEKSVEGITWIREMLMADHRLPPAGVVTDLGLIFSGNNLEFQPSFPLSGDPWKRLIHSYEDHVLGRIAASPLREDYIDALAGVPQKNRGAAMAFVIGRFLERTGYRAQTPWNTAILRRVFRGAPVDIFLAAESIMLTEEISELFLGEYETLLHNVRATHNLLTENDIFILENFEALNRFSRRLELEQVLDAARLFREGWPRKIKKIGRRMGAVATNISDENTYPTGGFSALSTRGTMENLVPSELIYMEDGPELNFFEMRFCEGELLYYSRDDSSFFREERTLVFEFHPDLVRARFKDTNLPWQRLTLLQGLVAASVAYLKNFLREENLNVRILFPGVEGLGADDEHPLKSEKELLELILRQEIESGLVSFEWAEFDDLPGERIRTVFYVEDAPEEDPALIKFRVGNFPDVNAQNRRHFSEDEDAQRAWVDGGLFLMGLLL